MSISRWVLRRQRKLIVVSTVLFIVLIIYVFTFHEDIKIQEKHFQPFSERCLSGSAKSLVNNVVSKALTLYCTANQQSGFNVLEDMVL